ncbi:DUF3606 domain-containing protein [Cupriavidus sp. 2TAF22]|uniref:DUF3606 domain-containing protein n=1 Tax=unclassified Cupriavidus TaxID=2640874 RepID=UPI003F92FE4B
MSHDLKDFRPLDPGRVNTMDGVEVQYWCMALNCTSAELQEAVANAGDHISAVRARLEALYPERRHG